MKRGFRRFLSLLLTIALLTGLIGMLPANAMETALEDVTGASAGVATPLAEEREKLNFNQGWKFTRNYVPEAIDPTCDIELIKTWENVDLPHSVRLEPYMNSGVGKIYQGDAMYVKYFPLDSSYEGKKLYIRIAKGRFSPIPSDTA